jgi:hypothetical protein
MRLRLAVLAAASAFIAAPALAAAPGGAAPDFTGIDSNGVSHTLSDYKGKTVILEWTNHGCPYVQRHYEGNMQALQADLNTGDDVVWLSVISSAPGEQGYVEAAEANELTQSRGASPDAVILDPEGAIGRLYEAKTTPQLVLIDAEGVLQYDGAIDDSQRGPAAEANNYLRAAMDAVAEGRAPDPAQTAPYGCSVKYSS